MYITFKNYSTSAKMLISVGNQKYTVNPESFVEVFHSGGPLKFEAQSDAFEELLEGINEIDCNDKTEKLKDRILTKLTKKFLNKVTECVLNLSVKYEVTFNECQKCVINLFEGAYSFCDGKIADAFDMPPVAMVFSRAETDFGETRATEVSVLNRKKYIKLWRNILLFANWGLFFLDLFFFIPEYYTVKILSSHFFLKKVLVSLYKKSPMERERILADKERKYDGEAGCFTYILKGLLVFLFLIGIVVWIGESEPDVIISEDFSSVVCFEETFVRIDGGLPSDAEDVFLEDYTAYYPLADGEYDMDNYYCYIYETSDGTRYMWLKDNCTAIENSFKEYEDYETPLVYKSIEEKE